MKKMVAFTLTIVFVFTMTLTVYAQPATNFTQGVTPSEAEKIALVFAKQLPELSNTELSASTAVLAYDAVGKKSGYIVEIFTGDKFVASVTTSTLKNQYPVLESYIGWSPLEAARKASGSVGGPEKSNRVLFTGPLSYYLETIDNNLIDLKSEKKINRAQMHVFTNPSYSAKELNLWAIGTTGDVTPQSSVVYLDSIDGVRNYNSPAYNTCGPTAGAMVFNYWYEQKGKTGLQEPSDIYTGTLLIDKLKNLMNTGAAGTSISNWIAGMTSHLRNSGYDDSTSAAVEMGNTWSGYVDQITYRQPMGVYIGQNYGELEYSYHWVTGIGWLIDETSTKYLQINDAAQGGASTVYINYAAYSQYVLDFVRVIVNQRTI